MMFPRLLDSLVLIFSYVISYIIVGFVVAIAVSLLLAQHQYVAQWYIQLPVFFLAGDACFKLLNFAFRGAVQRALRGRPLTLFGCVLERRRRRRVTKCAPTGAPRGSEKDATGMEEA